MSKILNYEREHNTVTMTVLLDNGHKQKWTYIREETAIGYNYLMVDREEA